LLKIYTNVSLSYYVWQKWLKNIKKRLTKWQILLFGTKFECMKVYRLGLDKSPCYNIIIKEDNGDMKVAFVGTKKVREYFAQEKNVGGKLVRLIYGAGSSMPYKDHNGNLDRKYTLVYDSEW